MWKPITAMGVATDSYPFTRRPKTAPEFLEYCSSLGAGGVQADLGSRDRESLRTLRGRAEELGMYIEISAYSLPREDTSEFESILAAAKETGARCVRTFCLGGRRYEQFSTYSDWTHFVADSKQRLAIAARIAGRLKMPVAIENHKDWTTDEAVALMREFGGEYFGMCVDTGNNFALLDDTTELVDRLAPYAVSVHLKDMAAAEYEDGLLLVEVPLGEGMLDLKRIVDTLRRERPATPITLEMMTRSPLRVPCLGDKYWATFPNRNAVRLARTMALVRATAPRGPLPQVDGLSAEARIRLEEENVKRCLSYARERLGLV